MQYNKALGFSDFSNPALTHYIVAALNAPGNPFIHHAAKAWEIGMTVRALHELGALRPDSEILGVGAGSEATTFYLTNHCKRVFATDLYAAGDVWSADAPTRMLVRPEEIPPHWIKFNLRRLVVQHMNALDLRYEDNSFDGIYSCGSIEHFGTEENIKTAAREMGRVTKPGGIVTLATEYRIDGPDGVGIPGCVLFTPQMIIDWIVRPSGLEPVDPIDFSVEQQTIDHVYPLEEAVQKGIRPISIALSIAGYRYTSIFLALRKV